MSDNPKPRHPAQQKALELLVEGLSDKDVAERLGVPRATVWAWAQTREFRDEIRHSQELAMGMVRDRIALGVTTALDVIIELMQDKEVFPPTRLKAALSFLDRAMGPVQALKDSDTKATVYVLGTGGDIREEVERRLAAKGAAS